MSNKPKFAPKIPAAPARDQNPQNRRRAEDARGGYKRPREESHSSAHVRHSSGTLQKKRRIGGSEVVTLPIVMSTNVVNARKAYYEKFRSLIGFELDDDMKDVEDRLLKWTEQRLRHEGVALFRLSGKLTGSMYDDLILTFSNQNPSTDLPFHRFAAGDIVLISRYGTVDLKRYEGSVLSRNPKFLKVVVSEVPAELEATIWRVDKGANRVAHDRMKVALDIFTSNNHELDDGSRPWAQKSKIKEVYLPQKDITSAFKKIIMDEPARGAALAKEPSILTPLHLKEDLSKLMKGWKLNEIQSNTIRAVLTHRLSLIQGPPGTGKTHTAIHLLRLLTRIYRDESIPILATAYTNVAVDNLLEGLRNAGIDALRLGRPVKVREELRDATLQARVEAHAEYPKLQALRQSLTDLMGGPSGSRQKASIKVADKGEGHHDIWEKQKEIRETGTPHRFFGSKSTCPDAQILEKRITADIIRKAQVICCTCIGAGDPILDEQYFPLVVLDESTQAVEPATLVPLVKGAQHVIMLGDHYQLPPTVKSDRALEGGLRESLFERLVKTCGLMPYVLLAQYRMHPTLSRFPSAHFYSNQLTDAVSEADRPLPSGFPWHERKPLAFIDMKSPEHHSSDGHSKTNAGEAALVVNIVRSFLVDGDLTRTDIGIISPYAGQVKLLHEHFGHESIFTTATSRDEMDEGEYAQTQIAGGLNVATVDGFQGREKQLIVFSCVRSNPGGRVGFLADWRRLNVAITRAKRGLIVVGDSTCLFNDPHWQRWLLWVNSQGCCYNSKLQQVKLFEGVDFDPTEINSGVKKTPKPETLKAKSAKATENNSDSDSETPTWVRFDSKKAPKSMVDLAPETAQTVLDDDGGGIVIAAEPDPMELDADNALQEEADMDEEELSSVNAEDMEGVEPLSPDEKDAEVDEKGEKPENEMITITSAELDAILKAHRSASPKKKLSPPKKNPPGDSLIKAAASSTKKTLDLSSSQDLSRSFEVPNIPEYIVPDSEEIAPLIIVPPPPKFPFPGEHAAPSGPFPSDLNSESNDFFMTPNLTPNLTPDLTPHTGVDRRNPFAGPMDLNDSANDILDPRDIIRIEKVMHQGIRSAAKPKSELEKKAFGTSSTDGKEEEAPLSFINIDKDPTSTPLKVSNFPSVLPKPSPTSTAAASATASQPRPPIILTLSGDGSSDDDAEHTPVKESGTHVRPKLSDLQEIESPTLPAPSFVKPEKKKKASILDSSSESSGEDNVENEQLELALDPPRAPSKQ